MAHLRRMHLEFETSLAETRSRLGELGELIESRAGAQEKKIVAELKVLETLMRDFATRISRSAAAVPAEPQRAQRGPASAYIKTLDGQGEMLETIRSSLE